MNNILLFFLLTFVFCCNGTKKFEEERQPLSVLPKEPVYDAFISCLESNDMRCLSPLLAKRVLLEDEHDHYEHFSFKNPASEFPQSRLAEIIFNNKAMEKRVGYAGVPSFREAFLKSSENEYCLWHCKTIYSGYTIYGTEVPYWIKTGVRVQHPDWGEARVHYELRLACDSESNCKIFKVHVEVGGCHVVEANIITKKLKLCSGVKEYYDALDKKNQK